MIDRKADSPAPARPAPSILPGLERAARRSLAGAIERGAESYDWALHLPRLIPVGPGDIADHSLAGRRAILGRLARALRAERNRGRAGHWSYDLNRHIGLRQAYLAERRMLDGAS
jgi:hypothetical protein